MIPKKIHYCWFGKNDLTSKARKCIASWKNYCPDYKIIEWNEDNYDVYQNPYTQKMYGEKKYAFLSDYVRLQIIYKEGGIYFDVDVEVIRSLDNLLRRHAFCGFEDKKHVNTGLGFGAEKEHPMIKNMLREYDILLDGTKGPVGCPVLNTQALKRQGLICNGKSQMVQDMAVYAIPYFNPYDDPTGILRVTSKTYTIHWYAKSWLDRKTILRSKLTKPLHRIFGTEFFRKEND